MTSEEFTPQPTNSLPGAAKVPAAPASLPDSAELSARAPEVPLHEQPLPEQPRQEMPQPQRVQGNFQDSAQETGQDTGQDTAHDSPRHLSLSGVRPLSAEPTRPTPAFTGFLPPSSPRRAATTSETHPASSTPRTSETHAAPGTPTTAASPAAPALSTTPNTSPTRNISDTANTPPAPLSPAQVSEKVSSQTASPSVQPQDAPPFAHIPSEHIFATPDAYQSQPQKKRRWGRIILTFFLVLGFLLTAIGGTLLVQNYVNKDDRAIVPATTDAPPSIPTTPDGTPNWEGVSAAVASSVVTINVSAGNSGSVGSGVIYTADGLILTNDHVINTAQNGGEIRVTLTDQRYYAAEIVGTDPSTDLAVIRLINPPSDLTVASFGTSGNLLVGQPVMAIGAPLGLSNTVTTGIISALNRPVEVSAERRPNPNDPFAQLDPRAMADDTIITNAIQIDASINPGNSGGPLFNAKGQVIGINSSIASIAKEGSDSAGSIGLGFAIPVDLARKVADQLVNKGRVAHAILGVTIKSVALDVKGTAHLGAQIDKLTPDGAADRAGLHSGDLITHIDGNRVASAQALQGIIRAYTAGDEIKVTIVRDGDTLDLPVVLQERE